MQVRTIQDTAIVTLPEEAVPAEAIYGVTVDLLAAPELNQWLQEIALRMMGSQGVRATLVNYVQWTVTTSPDIVAAWEPVCACEVCDEGKVAAIQRFRDGARFVAFCDMEYVQVRNSQ